jgi:hypothetical protein
MLSVIEHGATEDEVKSLLAQVPIISKGDRAEYLAMAKLN